MEAVGKASVFSWPAIHRDRVQMARAQLGITMMERRVWYGALDEPVTGYMVDTIPECSAVVTHTPALFLIADHVQRAIRTRTRNIR